MSNRPPALANAIRDLADANSTLHVAANVSDEEALEFVDRDVIVEWFEAECRDESPQSVLAEVIAERLTDAETVELVRTITAAHPQRAVAFLVGALTAHVAHWLAGEADKAAAELGADTTTNPVYAEQYGARLVASR